MQNSDPSSLPDLTNAQIQKLLSTACEQIKKLIEGMDLANEYDGEGGYDREMWNQICDGLSREAMGADDGAGRARASIYGQGLRAGRAGGRGYHAARGRDA